MPALNLCRPKSDFDPSAQRHESINNNPSNWDRGQSNRGREQPTALSIFCEVSLKFCPARRPYLVVWPVFVFFQIKPSTVTRHAIVELLTSALSGLV
jgi:hypothetical protein